MHLVHALRPRVPGVVHHAHVAPEQAIPAPGARPRTHNVLDTFTIDWSLCMYCGVCIEQCPTDALVWGGAHVPSADRLVDLLHHREQLAQPDA